MLTRVDRVQLAVRDRALAEETFRDLLGAQKVREDVSSLLHARRSAMQAGSSEFELLHPDLRLPVQPQMHTMWKWCGQCATLLTATD